MKCAQFPLVGSQNMRPKGVIQKCEESWGQVTTPLKDTHRGCPTHPMVSSYPKTLRKLDRLHGPLLGLHDTYTHIKIGKKKLIKVDTHTHTH